MAFAIIFASSCKKNLDETHKSFQSPTVVLDTLQGVITANRTVSTNAYIFGIVYVRPGVTLTINPGVTVYGSQSTVVPGPSVIGGVFDTTNLQRNKGTLCIQTGAKLNAAGVLGNPIIWTSDDKIPVGQRKLGDWGGLVVYGLATFHNAAGNTTTTRFEAFDLVPTRLENFYGGSNDADNSGTITYNRFEFGGGVVTAVNKEVNGLTLCAVGCGTTINHVEVLKAGDDGVEFFGGAVNIDHFLVYAAKDDDYDFDEGYHGHLQFIVSYRDTTADNSGSHNIEADNDAAFSNVMPYTSPFIANATLIGPFAQHDICSGTATTASYFDGAVLARRRVSLKLVNSYVIANAMPYGLVFTPTTGNGSGSAPVSTLLDPPSLALPGNVQAFNIYQINNPGFAGLAVQSPIEGNPVPCGLVNDPILIAKLSSGNNGNNGLNTYNDFMLGGTLENTASTPFLHTGVDLNTVGIPTQSCSFKFVSTDERGGVTTTDNWTLAGVTTGTPWISIAIQ